MRGPDDIDPSGRDRLGPLAPYPRPLGAAGLRPTQGPLAAHPDPGWETRRRGAESVGRWRRFTIAYGWRAYAIPLLTVATFLTMLDLSTTGNAGVPRPSTIALSLSESTPSESTPSLSSTTATPSSPAPTTVAPAPEPAVTAAASYVQQGTGTLSVVPGTSALLGSGPTRTFHVEVEDGIKVDNAAFAAAVEATLGDPRSWGHDGKMSFQRVDGPDADFSVALVSPDSVETYCPGYGTEGYTSCRNGDRAVVNLARWETAVPDYAADIATYRQYVVNHEVGHYLGHGHEPCPGPGELAPVMQQQTLGLNGCAKNSWPYP